MLWDDAVFMRGQVVLWDVHSYSGGKWIVLWDDCEYNQKEGAVDSITG